MTKPQNPEFERFDTTMVKILSVSREELAKREKAWKKRQARKKRAKTSPASPASTAKA